MLIVGLNHGEINSSAAVFHQGGIRAGAPEERFNRQKLTRLFPAGALNYCLNYVGVDLSDADCGRKRESPVFRDIATARRENRLSYCTQYIVQYQWRAYCV